MKRPFSSDPAPLTRVASILPFIRWLDSIEYPADRVLARARIPKSVLDYPDAILPLEQAFQFGEECCSATGSGHFGLFVGLATPVHTIGPYGRLLLRAETVGQYLQMATQFFSWVTTGQRLVLAERQNHCLLMIESVNSSAEAGQYQSHLHILAITVNKIREAAGPDWSPPRLGLAYSSPEPMPANHPFCGTRISFDSRVTCLSIPLSILTLPMACHLRSPGESGDALGDRALPDDFMGLVESQVEAMLSNCQLTLDAVARSLGTSARTLQRSLSQQDRTFSQLISQMRLRKATWWLEQSDKPITEIAMDLGYSDASNFTRAFRRRSGVSPQAFRDTVKVS